MSAWRIGQWLYLPFKGYAGAVTYAPAALIDRETGRVYSIIPGLSNDEAATLTWG